MAIGAPEHDMRCLVHRLDADMALVAPHTLGVSRCLGLIDPVLRGTGRGFCDRNIRGDRNGRTVAGGGVGPLGKDRGRVQEKKRKQIR